MGPHVPNAWPERAWSAWLSERLEQGVRVEFGRSRTVPVQVRHERAALCVRLHHMFAGAPEEVREALPRWIRSGRRARKACTVLDTWIHAALAALPARSAPEPRLAPRGGCHDLERLAAPLFAREFAGDFASADTRPLLTWGRRGRSRSRHSLRLGSYDAETRVVRLHRVLDQPAVPEWFVRYVLFHEILHAAHPPRPGPGNQWIHHGAEFRRREARYADYARALRWEQLNLPRLIACARRGSPLRPSALARVEPAAPNPRLAQGTLF